MTGNRPDPGRPGSPARHPPFVVGSLYLRCLGRREDEILTEHIPARSSPLLRRRTRGSAMSDTISTGLVLAALVITVIIINRKIGWG